MRQSVSPDVRLPLNGRFPQHPSFACCGRRAEGAVQRGGETSPGQVQPVHRDRLEGLHIARTELVALGIEARPAHDPAAFRRPLIRCERQRVQCSGCARSASWPASSSWGRCRAPGHCPKARAGSSPVRRLAADRCCRPCRRRSRHATAGARRRPSARRTSTPRAGPGLSRRPVASPARSARPRRSCRWDSLAARRRRSWSPAAG